MKTRTTRKTTDARSRGDWQGSKWIRREKRLAIYLRDGLACVWCGQSIEDGVNLSLDHLRPHSQRGNNEARNLVTCCKRCNDSRGNRSIDAFASSVAAYLNHGVTCEQVASHVRDCSLRPIDVPAAKELISRRGGFVAALRK